ELLVGKRHRNIDAALDKLDATLCQRVAINCRAPAKPALLNPDEGVDADGCTRNGIRAAAEVDDTVCCCDALMTALPGAVPRRICCSFRERSRCCLPRSMAWRS